MKTSDKMNKQTSLQFMRNSLFILFVFALCRLDGKAETWMPVRLTSKVEHVQPMTGLVLWPDEAEDRYATYGTSHALEFSYVAPCKVVKDGKPGESIVYDWSYLDAILDAVASRKHQAVIRFFYEYPGEKMVDDVRGTSGVPAYIKNLPDYHEMYRKVEGDGETWYADWSHPELQRFTKVFYSDLAARYHHDARIAFVEVGFGHWSEYHIYDGSDESNAFLQFGRNFPSKAYQKEFFLHLDSVMQGLPWAVSIDAADAAYTPFVGDAELMGLTFGLFDDSFMHQGHEVTTKDGYNERNWIAMGLDRWQSGVCGGEISYYKDSDQKNFLNPDGMYGHTWEEQAAKYHISFMIANDAPRASVTKYPHNTPERFKEGSMATGYHFAVTACRTNGIDKTELTVTNTGVAPLYRDAFFAIGGVRAAESLAALLPGQSLVTTVPVALSVDATGAPTMQPVIVSDYILDTQAIEYDALTTSDVSAVKIPDAEPIATYDVQGRRLSVSQPCGFVVGPTHKVFCTH